MPTILHIYAVQFTFFSFKEFKQEYNSENYDNLLTEKTLTHQLYLLLLQLHCQCGVFFRPAQAGFFILQLEWWF